MQIEANNNIAAGLLAIFEGKPVPETAEEQARKAALFQKIHGRELAPTKQGEGK